MKFVVNFLCVKSIACLTTAVCLDIMTGGSASRAGGFYLLYVSDLF